MRLDLSKSCIRGPVSLGAPFRRDILDHDDEITSRSRIVGISYFHTLRPPSVLGQQTTHDISLAVRHVKDIDALATTLNQAL